MTQAQAHPVKKKDETIPKKTATPPVNEAQIPDHLKRASFWLVWNGTYDRKKKRWIKPPFNPRFPTKPASTNDRNTLGPFMVAYNSYKANRFDGVGFVFSPHHDISGIDLDDAVRDDGSPKDWARAIINSIPTYWEKSPSGTGFHGYVRGKIPGVTNVKKALRQNTKEAIEIFCSSNYLTVTGAVVSSLRTVEPCQAQLEALYNRYFKNNPPVKADKKGNG